MAVRSCSERNPGELHNYILYIIYILGNTKLLEIGSTSLKQVSDSKRVKLRLTRVAAMHGVTFAQVATVLVSLHASVLQ